MPSRAQLLALADELEKQAGLLELIAEHPELAAGIAGGLFGAGTGAILPTDNNLRLGNIALGALLGGGAGVGLGYLGRDAIRNWASGNKGDKKPATGGNSLTVGEALKPPGKILKKPAPTQNRPLADQAESTLHPDGPFMADAKRRAAAAGKPGPVPASATPTAASPATKQEATPTPEPKKEPTIVPQTAGNQDKERQTNWSGNGGGEAKKVERPISPGQVSTSEIEAVATPPPQAEEVEDNLSDIGGGTSSFDPLDITSSLLGPAPEAEAEDAEPDVFDKQRTQNAAKKYMSSAAPAALTAYLNHKQ